MVAAHRCGCTGGKTSLPSAGGRAEGHRLGSEALESVTEDRPVTPVRPSSAAVLEARICAKTTGQNHLYGGGLAFALADAVI